MEENKEHAHQIEITDLEIMATDGSSADDIFNRAITLKKAGQTDEAVKYLEQSLSMNPDNIECLYNLGIVYRDMENYPKALEIFQRANKVQPKNSKILYALAKTYEQSDIKEAIRCYEQCLQSEDNAVLVEVAKERLKAIKKWRKH